MRCPYCNSEFDEHKVLVVEVNEYTISDCDCVFNDKRAEILRIHVCPFCGGLIYERKGEFVEEIIKALMK